MAAIDKFRLDGKAALVTGATRGLGKEIANALASAGANVMVAGRNQKSADETAASIAKEYAVKAVGIGGDLAAANVAEDLVRATVERLGRIDILVNNAGIADRGPIEDKTPDEFDLTMAVNVRAPWVLCRAAAAHFKKQTSGRVINIASCLSIRAFADHSLYCTSKGALIQLTRSLAVEWAEHNITVNAICPGPFATDMNALDAGDPVRSERIANLTAMGRWGRIDEIGPAVLFLASDAASFVTGALLPVDGGLLAK